MLWGNTVQTSKIKLHVRCIITQWSTMYNCAKNVCRLDVNWITELSSPLIFILHIQYINRRNLSPRNHVYIQLICNSKYILWHNADWITFFNQHQEMLLIIYLVSNKWLWIYCLLTKKNTTRTHQTYPLNNDKIIITLTVHLWLNLLKW